MKIILIVDSREYVSQDFSEDIVGDVDTLAEFVYDAVNEEMPMQLTLKDGSIIVIGRDKLQESFLRIVE
jgi:hypothetical protein